MRGLGTLSLCVVVSTLTADAATRNENPHKSLRGNRKLQDDCVITVPGGLYCSSNQCPSGYKCVPQTNTWVGYDCVKESCITPAPTPSPNDAGNRIDDLGGLPIGIGIPIGSNSNENTVGNPGDPDMCWKELCGRDTTCSDMGARCMVKGESCYCRDPHKYTASCERPKSPAELAYVPCDKDYIFILGGSISGGLPQVPDDTLKSIGDSQLPIITGPFSPVSSTTTPANPEGGEMPVPPLDITIPPPAPETPVESTTTTAPPPDAPETPVSPPGPETPVPPLDITIPPPGPVTPVESTTTTAPPPAAPERPVPPSAPETPVTSTTTTSGPPPVSEPVSSPDASDSKSKKLKLRRQKQLV